MGRPPGAISKIANELDVDPKTVRRSLEAAGLTKEQAEADLPAAIVAVRPFVDKERVISHQATRVTTNPQMADARRRLEELKARRLEIEIQQAEGQLVDRASVIESIVTIFGNARTEALNLGVRCVNELIGLSDPKEIVKIIEDEMRRIFDRVADDLPYVEPSDLDALS